MQTSYSRAPAVAGLEVPEGSPAGVERAIETERGTARIVFPDELHERLYDLAEGRPDKAEARALYGELEGFVLENFRGPADVIALARDYRAEVLDQARTAAQYRGGRPEAAALVVDPDEQTRYLQRPTLASLRARVDRAMGRQPAAEGQLPETALAVTPGDVPTVESSRQRVRAGIQASAEPGTAQADVQGSAGPGAAYVGFVQDQVEGVASAKADKPIRREDILRPLLKDLGVPVDQGRIKSKKFLGFYRRTSRKCGSSACPTSRWRPMRSRTCSMIGSRKSAVCGCLPPTLIRRFATSCAACPTTRARFSRVSPSS